MVADVDSGDEGTDEELNYRAELAVMKASFMTHKQK